MDLQGGGMYEQLIVRYIIILYYNHNFNDGFLSAGVSKRVHLSTWSQAAGTPVGGFMHACVCGWLVRNG